MDDENITIRAAITEVQTIVQFARRQDGGIDRAAVDRIGQMMAVISMREHAITEAISGVMGSA